MALAINRKCRPVFEGQDNSSSDDSANRDPFKCSDNERDLDYQPSPKKARTDVRKARKVVKKAAQAAGGRKKTAAASKLSKQFETASPKELTAKERLNRLKQKFGLTAPSAKSTEPSATSTHIPNQASQSVTDDNKNGEDSQLKSENAESNGNDPSFGSYDHVFDMANIEMSSSLKPEIVNLAECFNSEIVGLAEPSSSQNSAVLDVVLGLRDSVSEIISNLTLVRKQICRLEVKSMGAHGPAFNVAAGNEVNPELLLDLDDALAKEGIPIKTCVELNEIEVKLRRDPKYRQKLVCNIFLKYT